MQTRANNVSEENKLDLQDFYSTNRFLYDSIKINKGKIKDIANDLKMSYQSLRRKLISLRIPVTAKSLYSQVNSLKELSDPPLCYTLINEKIRIKDDTKFTDQHIELLIPIKDYHFDFQSIVKSYFEKTPDDQAINFIRKNICNDNEIDKIIPSVPNESKDFAQEMIENFNSLPDVIKRLTDDERYIINKHLSIAYLSGKIQIPIAGIASPHLQGTFHLAMRKENTGFMLIDQNIPQISEVEDKMKDVLEWLKIHNHLYSNLDEPSISSLFNVVVETNTSAQPIGLVVNPEKRKKKQTNKIPPPFNVPIKCKNGEGYEWKYVSLELALCSTFPLLFPEGNLSPVPGKTIREKGKNILLSHEYYRCGRIACELILWIYNMIEETETSYFNQKINIQKVVMPSDSSRDIPGNVRYNDPSFEYYWKNKQSQVRAMASIFGNPDLMITFTFCNDWKEVNIQESQNKSILNYKLDMRFCPIDSMMIWLNRFNSTKANSFKFLIENIGFGTPAHFMWRLEFQARGAPHVHALIWLEKPISEDRLYQIMHADTPGDDCPILREYVLKFMVHNCNPNRCLKNRVHCKYGYPRDECHDPHYDADGRLQLIRGSDDSRIVDYNPFFLLFWGGHCHINVLRTDIRNEVSSNALHYILKYNFKVEPSLRVHVGTDDMTDWRTMFEGRYISVEEASFRIFGQTFCEADIQSKYISLKPSDLQQGVFKDGDQVQMTPLQQYFHRPLHLDAIGILDFFSYYDIVATQFKNSEQIEFFEKNLGSSSPPKTVADSPRLQLVDSFYLFPCENLPNAKALQCKLRTKPIIIMTEKFFGNASTSEQFCFLHLLLSRCWRSEEEMRANCSSWREALAFHKISTFDDLTHCQMNLVKYMINSPRYSLFDMLRILNDMEFDVLDFLNNYHDSTQNERLLEKLDILIKNWKQFLEYKENEETSVQKVSDFDESLLKKYIKCDFDEDELKCATERMSTNVPLLNDDQKYVFDEISSRILAGIQINCFVSGKAGTGKSFLINTISNLLILNNIPFIICASTGIAAMLIKGKTVHSAFGLFNDDDKIICGLNVDKPNGISMTYVKVIIIDEVTMISADVLDAVNSGLQKIMAQLNSEHSDKPFGGKSILLFGDLAQVPAVCTKRRSDYIEYLAQFNNSDIYDHFIRFDLNIIMRQNPDQLGFIKALADIREAIPSENGKAYLSNEINNLLKSRFIRGPPHMVLPEVSNFLGDGNSLCICFTNDFARNYNKDKLDSISSIKNMICTLKGLFFIRSTDSYRANYDSHVQINCEQQKSVVQNRFAIESEIAAYRGAIHKKKCRCLIPFNIDIAIGAKVMLLKNIDTEKGLINGARGIVIDIDIKESIVEAVKIKFNHIMDPIAIVRQICHSYCLDNGRKIVLYQFPINLCWAATAHKSQGQTLERVAINIGEEAFAHGALYVALSRVRSIDDVVLFGQNDWPDDGLSFHVNSYIRGEMLQHFQ